MLVAIHAYEQMYGGLHGMEQTAIVDVENLEEAEDYAVEMSYDVMDSYSCIIESFEEDAYSEGLEEGTREWDEFIEECRSENNAYELWPITETKGKTVEELESEFFNDKHGFVEAYCKDC